MNRLVGKVALITGAARGQGEAEARLFVAEGAKVLVTDVLDKRGQAVADDLGNSAGFCHLDVAKEEDWEAAVTMATEVFGRLDILVNNAAIVHLAAIEDTSLQDFQRVVAVNQLGVFLGMKAVLPAMKASHGGSIVNVSSKDGVVGMNGVGAYAATKFAVRGLTKVGALEFGKYGIRVNTLIPGAVNTPMNTPEEADGVDRDSFFSHQPIPRIGQPDELAAAALFLASNDSSYCTGAELIVDGGACAGNRVPGVPGY
jgi:3alpha(or 20beta)-hydroxysteroid dehydrogenase